jgi:hypothetical protein
MPRLEAVTAVEPVVLAVAADGVGELVRPDLRGALRSVGGCPTLLSAFGAWAKLSLGRSGSLDTTTAARFPWLLLYALAPALLYRALARTRGRVAAVIGAAALGFCTLVAVEALLSADRTGNIGWWMLVLAGYWATLQPRHSVRRRQCCTVAAAFSFALALALSRSALWVAFVCVLHLPLARLAAARWSAQRGRLPMPTFVLFGLPLALPLLILLNPELWQKSPVQIAGFLLAPIGGAQSDAQDAALARLGAPIAILVAAGLGAVVEIALARARGRGLKRAFAAADGAAPLALAAVGLFVTLLLPQLFPPQLAALRPPRECSWIFAAVGVALLADGVRALVARAASGSTEPAAPPHST